HDTTLRKFRLDDSHKAYLATAQYAFIRPGVHSRLQRQPRNYRRPYTTLFRSSSSAWGGSRRRPSSARISASRGSTGSGSSARARSEEHTSELQSRFDLVCRLLLEKKKRTSIV